MILFEISGPSTGSYITQDLSMNTTKKRKRRKIPWLKMIAQNAQGMSSIVKLQAIVNNFEKRNFFAAFISETWREGDEKLKQNHTYIYGSAEATKSCNRGAKGVAIMLSTQAEEARKAANLYGPSIFCISPRVMAVRLELKKGKENMMIFLVSVYAPNSSHTEEDWEEFYEDVDRCMDKADEDDIIVVGGDFNAQMGVQDKNMNDKVCGRYGIRKQTKNGRVTRNWAAMHNLASMASFFRRKRNYGTWKSMNGKSAYTLDHIMIDNKNKKLVRDCGVKASIVRSDHKGVMMKLNMKVNRLQKKPKDKRTVRINKDFSKLSLTAKSDEEREEREQYRAEFVEEVMKILRETKDMTTEEFAQYKSDRAQASKAK